MLYCFIGGIFGVVPNPRDGVFALLQKKTEPPFVLQNILGLLIMNAFINVIAVINRVSPADARARVERHDIERDERT